MNTLILLFRLFFGAIFIFSGVQKLKDPIAFADAVRNYQIVGDPIAPAMALFIPWIELIAGLAVMIWTSRFGRAGVFVLEICLVIFTLAIAFSWGRGLDISCGCFGSKGEVNYPLKIAFNSSLLAVGVFLLKKRDLPET